MTTIAPLRILTREDIGDSGASPVQESPRPRERNAATRSRQALQKLPDSLQESTAAIVSAWLETHARPAIADYVEDRATRPILIGIPRAARLTDLSEAAIERMLADGFLPTVKVGARRLIRLADLERWAEGLPVDGGR